MPLTATRQRLLTINNTKAYTAFGPGETVQLYNETKGYLTHQRDSQLSAVQHLALMEMWFYLAVYCSEDVEAQIIYNKVRDQLGDASCKLQVMRATLIQFNESPQASIKYLETLLREEYAFNTDMVSYAALAKKLLSMRMYCQTNDNKSGWIKQINTLLEKCPLDPELWWFLAQLYESTQQYDNSVHCIQEVLLVMPFNYVAFAKLAEIYTYQAMATKRNHQEKVAVLQLALDNALRSVELSELYVKGWVLVKSISEKLEKEFAVASSEGANKKILIKLAQKKLEEIKINANDNDKHIANYILSQ